jgi:hypothetical protein
MAGRYEEIFTPDMIVAHPTYHIHAHGLRVRLDGQEEIKDLYRVWAATNESVFYTEWESVAVTDHYVSSVAAGYQQISWRSLFQNRVLSRLPAFIARFFLNRSFGRDTFESNETSMYLYKSTFYMIWRCDERGRLLGEDIWEPEPSKAEITKLAPSDVLTTKEAGRLLAPFIIPLPSLEMILAKSETAMTSPAVYGDVSTGACAGSYICSTGNKPPSTVLAALAGLPGICFAVQNARVCEHSAA